MTTAQMEAERQEKTRRMVQMHVYANVTPLVEYVNLRVWQGYDDDAPWNEDDIENYWTLPDDWEADELNEWLADNGHDWADIAGGDPYDVSEPTDDEIDRVRDFVRENSAPAEVFEWYLVSDWLASQLRHTRQVLVSDGTNWYWGRQGSGQAIYMDGYMQDIAQSLEF